MTLDGNTGRPPDASSRFHMVQAAPTFVGIDVSKTRLDVCFWPVEDHLRFENSVDGICQLVSVLREQPVELVAFEHTGRMTRELIDQLRGAEVPSVILDSKKVRRFATVIGREGKSDKMDARLNAQFAATLRPNVSPLPTQEERELQDLVRRCRRLSSMSAGEKSTLAEGNAPVVAASVVEHVGWLAAQLTKLEHEVDRRIAERPDWRRRSEIIQSMPSGGPGLARTLIADLPELGRTEHKPLSSLVGIAPLPKESGLTVRRRRIRGGRRSVRRALYMSSISGVRCNPVLAAYYQRLVAAGKPPMSARAATMRKMLHMLNAMVRDNSLWSEK